MTGPPQARTTPRSRGVVVSATLLLAIAALAGCRTPVAPEPPVSPPPPPPVPVAAGFVVAESMNDTWNTIGQVLLSLEGARYEARSQMLGLHQLRWRGEAMLLVAAAVPIDAESRALRTRVRTLAPGGAPLDSAGARELVGILAVRVPVEAPRYRQKVKLPGTPARARKRGAE